MKRIILLISILLILLFFGCSVGNNASPIVATTLPVYEFTYRLCAGTDLSVMPLITEPVSCLHDYALKVDQMQAIEAAEMVIVSGAGLEAFMEDALLSANNVVDSSANLSLMESEHHELDHSHDHIHEEDPHIWLSPVNAKHMAYNICAELSLHYPHYEKTFQSNLNVLTKELEDLQAYGEEALSSLSCRKLITFHDGFSYLAESFDLEIIRAVEEESGSEASATELIEIIGLINDNHLPAIFTEKNGSVSAASVICAETGISSYALDMAMSGGSYFESMYHNINTLQEALQ